MGLDEYMLGCDVLGAESPLYGPGSSSGRYYTDKETITAVQKKLEQLGYFHGVVDGVYGSVTNAAIRNYSGKDGPPDDELLRKLGLSKSITFTDDDVDSMIVQAGNAQTPAQVQLVASKVKNLSENASPDVKAQVTDAQNAAQRAVTPTEIAAAKKKVQDAAAKLKKGLPAWKVGLIAGGAGLGVILITVLAARVGGRRRH